MVTNPGTRTWEVTASTFATLNEHVRQPHGLRHRPRRLRDARAGPQAQHAGPAQRGDERHPRPGRGAGGRRRRHAVQIPWVEDGVPKLPVWMAAYGPKALEMAGAEADGFILQLADPYLTEWMVKAVRAAAEAAGRDPASITICVAAPAYVTADDLGARPRAVPLVRRHGRQPRRRPGHPLRRALRRCPRS